MTINILLDMVADAFPDRPALQYGDHMLTASQLRGTASALAYLVRDAGAEELVFVGVNGPLLPVVLFAAATAGVPAVPLNYRLPTAQVIELLNRLRRPLIVADPPFMDGIADGFTVRSSDGLIDQLLAGEAAGPLAMTDDNEQPAVVLFTSGTTAAPKAAVLRHRHLLSYVLQTVDFASAPDDDLALISVPPYHVAGVGSALTNIYSARRVIYLPDFSPERWLRLVRTQKVTVAMVVPTMLARIVEYLGGRAAGVPSLKVLSYGGSRTHQDVLESALTSFPTTGFVNAYGLTETSSTIALLGPDEHRVSFASAEPSTRGRLGSVGRPVPGIEVQIRGVDNEILPPGRVGELWVRGAQVAGEYADAGSVLDPDGWFRTRDLSRLDHDGYLYIEGRTDDIIIRGAENISPTEVEAVMKRHPDVRDVAVLGLPDTEWGERIAAVVVLRPGATADPVALRGWVRQQSRSSRTPDVVIVREALPYSPTGKLLRRELFEELTAR